MDEVKKIEFTVGEQYENEKGVFTVVSKKRGEMVIRWEDGNEVSTAIDLQRRIAERRQWEKDNPPRPPGSTKKSSAARKMAARAVFEGFAPADFKNSASGTTWRSRGQLGGSVARQIKSRRYTFNSWAFSHKPEMHLQDVRYRDGATDSCDARFFVRLDTGALHYGFRVARRENGESTPSHGDNFCKWMGQPENGEKIASLAAEYGLVARDRTSATDAPADETLSACTRMTEGAGDFDLELSAVVEKAKAVEDGADVANAMAALFVELIPLYQAAVSG